MTTSGFLGVPDTVDVSVEWPKGGKQGASHAELFAVLGAEMSKAVLGQTLTTEQGSKGSQALGRVHDGVRKDIKEFDARSIAETIRRDLIAPLVRMNFGNDADIPIFRFITTETEDMGSFAAGVSTLKSAGLRIPAAWVRDRVGMPQPDDDDEILGEPDGDEEDIPIDPATGLPTVPAEPANTEPAVATEPPDAPTSED